MLNKKKAGFLRFSNIYAYLPSHQFNRRQAMTTLKFLKHSICWYLHVKNLKLYAEEANVLSCMKLRLWYCAIVLFHIKWLAKVNAMSELSNAVKDPSNQCIHYIIHYHQEYCNETLVFSKGLKPGSDAAPLMCPNLTDELSTVKERRLNQFSTAVFFLKGPKILSKSMKLDWNFQRRGGCKEKSLLWWRYG